MKLFNKLDVNIFEAALILLAVIPCIILAVGNVNAVLNWFLTDDAFYYFQVARNVSEGVGFTFDGINLSNGFQPLWLFVCIPIFSLARFDLILPLRVLIVVMGLLHAGGAIFWFRLLRRYVLPELAAAVALFWAFSAPTLTIIAKNGLETGVNAFFILLLWERVTALNSQDELGKDGLKRIFWLGLIGTFTTLARLDNVFLVIAAAVWVWLRWWQPPQGEKASVNEKWQWRLKTGFAFNGVIVVVMVAYLIWNKIGFGNWMPVSGAVKLWWGSLPYSVYGYRVYDFQSLIAELFSMDNKVSPWWFMLRPVFQTAAWLLGDSSKDTELVVGTAWQVFAGFAVLTLVLIWFNREYFWKTAKQFGLLPFFLGTLVQAGYYKRFGSVPQKAWYWLGEMVWQVLLISLLIMMVYRLLTRLKFDWLKQAAMVVFLITVIYYPIRFFNYIVFDELPNGRAIDTHAYIFRAEFLTETFEPGTVIAITGSGGWGYFSGDVVIFNMDGLINSYEYLEAMQAGEGAAFMLDSGVDYILGNPYILGNTQPYGDNLDGHLELYTKYFPNYGSRKFVWTLVP